MAPVYEEISLDWKGKTYKLTPTFGHIQHIEQRLSLFSLYERLRRGESPLSQMAELLAEILFLVGCRDEDATAEHIHAEFYHGTNPLDLYGAATQIARALVPQKPLRGNAPTPEPGESQQPTSIGGTITKSQLDTLESSLQSSGE